MDDGYHPETVRRSRQDKAMSRERIVEVAARQIREHGLEGPGVAEIMRGAGMTHGGFYKHFESREELMAAAVEKALQDRNQAMFEAIADAPDPLAAFVDWYLSAEHVANPGYGCGVAALAGDLAHGTDELRDKYREQVERYLIALEQMVGTRARATVVLAALVGAVTVARALGTPPLADEILEGVRSALKTASDA